MVKIKLNMEIIIDKTNPLNCNRKCPYAKDHYGSQWRCKLFQKDIRVEDGQLFRCRGCAELFGTSISDIIEGATVEF